MWLVGFVFVFGIGILTVLRAYFLQFDHNFEQAALNSTWQEQLNLLSGNTHNWYIDHKSTLGSVKWWAKRLFVLMGVCMSVSGILSVFIGFVAIWIVVALGSLGLVTLTLYSWCRLPEETDVLFIRGSVLLLFLGVERPRCVDRGIENSVWNHESCGCDDIDCWDSDVPEW